MAAKKLSTRKVDTLGPGRYADGDGLYLIVADSKARKWQARFTLNGKRTWMGLGRARGDNLAAARKANERWQAEAREGRDPRLARDTEKAEALAAAQGIPTFTSCAARYIRAHRRGWKNRKHARQWVSTLKTYARPVIGKMPVDRIETAQVLEILSGVWNTKTETAKRVQGRLENILDYAAAHKHRDPLNPARWRGHLDKLLPRPARVKRVVHHPAMPYTEVPAFVAELAQTDGVSALALRFLILTATRTGEVLYAQWPEVDLEAAVWTVPAERMKARRIHRVPLSDAALTILEAAPRIEGNLYLFPGYRHGRPLSNMALLQVMRGLGYGVGGHRGDYVPHGFRSSFRDWSGEVSSFPRDVAEMALAHVIENKVEAAYRRGDLFEKRRRMMQDWSDYLGISAETR